MTRLTLAALLLLLMACAPKAPPAVGLQARAVQRIAEADALVRAGCYDCLLDALEHYEQARRVPATAETATGGALRAALLLAMRERELGFIDTGYLARARELAAEIPAAQASTGLFLEVAATIPMQGGAQRVSNDAELSVMSTAYRNRADWTNALRTRVNEDVFSTYLYMAFSCSYNVPTPDNIASWLGEITAFRDVPLIRFKIGTCGSFDINVLESLLSADARFMEIHYFIGLRSILAGTLDEAGPPLQRAYAWHEQWPGVTNSLGGLYSTAEDFEPSLAFYDRTLALVPNHPDALLGKAKALTYLGRSTEAIAVVDQLLALERWYIGDARYWRAVNEMQLSRYPEAWADIEEAGKLLVNAQVPKLAGVIAFRMQQLDTALARFEVSRPRDPADCETIFYIGVVRGELRQWKDVTSTLVEAATCLAASNVQLANEMIAVRVSEDPPEKKARQIAKREQQIGQQERMLAQSWFNTAVAHFNLQQRAEAGQYAQKVAGDPQFGERAREILSRVRPETPG
jgi:tetratricopeptide (TPR) repeat protein